MFLKNLWLKMLLIKFGGTNSLIRKNEDNEKNNIKYIFSRDAYDNCKL